jgi:hypothetical protein
MTQGVSAMTGYDEAGGYADVNGSGRYDSDGHRVQWELTDLGLDSRSVEVEGGKPGTYKYQLDYSELPYRRYDTTQTVFQQSTDELLVLPPGWVPAGTTGGFSALDANLADRISRATARPSASAVNITLKASAL